jgi:hypothetical protein
MATDYYKSNSNRKRCNSMIQVGLPMLITAQYISLSRTLGRGLRRMAETAETIFRAVDRL